MMNKIKFEEQEKSGFNSFGFYQFGSNYCIGCKKDRPLKEEGEWCDWCKNTNNFRAERSHNENIRLKAIELLVSVKRITFLD